MTAKANDTFNGLMMAVLALAVISISYADIKTDIIGGLSEGSLKTIATVGIAVTLIAMAVIMPFKATISDDPGGSEE